MRTYVRKIVFLTVLILFYAASAPGISSQLIQIQTQSVGLFLLQPEWSVISKDEPPAQSPISDWILNVQQVLYASSAHTSKTHGATLQIFSIWGSDLDGNERPLPSDIVETCDKFVADLIGARYGNVSELGENVVETALENLSVGTYGVEFSLENGEKDGFRYKFASLYSGEKRVLVLLKYEPESEEYWSTRLETLLSAWVESLTLTPMPVPVIAASTSSLQVSLPTLESSDITPIAASPEQFQPVQDTLAPKRIAMLAPFILLFILCVYRLLIAHKRLTKKEYPAPPLPVETKSTFLEIHAEQETNVQEINVYVPAENEGFDKVYSILDQALNYIETAAPPSGIVVRKRAAMTVLPNMADTLEVMGDLKKTFGDAPVLDALENEIFKVLELNSETRPTLHANPDSNVALVLKLCCDTLTNMLKTGRFHVDKGILSNEGTELVALHARISGLRTQKTHITPQEEKEEAEYMNCCIRESG